MARPRRHTLFIVGGGIGLLLLVALAAFLFVDVNPYKPRFEAAATDALGMEVRIGGRLRMGVLPGFHVVADDARILDEHGVPIASAKRTTLGVALLPLLRGEYRLRGVALQEPVLSIHRAPDGSFNVEKLRKALGLLGALDGGSLSIGDGILRYADGGSGDTFEATDVDLNVSRLRFAGGKRPQSRKDISLQAEIACGEIRTGNIILSSLRASVSGREGVFEFRPVTLRVFGGHGAGSLRADVSGPVPLYQAQCSLPRFRIEEFFKVLSPRKAVDGAMDFSASLSMQGTTMSRMVRTAAGEMSLRGRNLTLVGHDLDRELSRFKSSQRFQLVDVGAVFLAGPLGLAATKGYSFASLFAGSGGTSSIGTVVSDWRIERGIARAKDVAMTTTRNRIALRGGLDFVDQRFEDMTVAVVDARGCATARQAILGSFESPVVEKPRMLKSLAGPMLRLLRQTRRLLPSGPCEAFYTGSVAPPRPTKSRRDRSHSTITPRHSRRRRATCRRFASSRGPGLPLQKGAAQSFFQPMAFPARCRTVGMTG